MTDIVKATGLRGRGGAGFPSGLKWTFLPKDHPGPIYLCVNADESEPCTFNNRILMEEDPHQVLEGIILACYATKRDDGLLLHALRIWPLATARMQRAIDECYAADLLGKNILGKDFQLDIFLHRGAGAYICGEETGLIESLEGKRAWPRIKPPFPAVEGRVSQADRRQQHRDAGLRDAHPRPRRRLVQVDGRPARSEEPARRRQLWPEALLHQRPRQQAGLRRAAAGHHGPRADRQARRRRLEGPQGQGGDPRRHQHGPLTEAEFDTPLDFNGPGKVGCLGLGTAAVVVMDEQTSMVDVLLQQLPLLLARIAAASARPAARERAGCYEDHGPHQGAARGGWRISTCSTRSATSIGIMPGTTICGLADGAAWPIKNASKNSGRSWKSTSSRPIPAAGTRPKAVPALDHN